jgi:hypothetical protein
VANSIWFTADGALPKYDPYVGDLCGEHFRCSQFVVENSTTTKEEMDTAMSLVQLDERSVRLVGIPAHMRRHFHLSPWTELVEVPLVDGVTDAAALGFRRLMRAPAPGCRSPWPTVSVAHSPTPSAVRIAARLVGAVRKAVAAWAW